MQEQIKSKSPHQIFLLIALGVAVVLLLPKIICILFEILLNLLILFGIVLAVILVLRLANVRINLSPVLRKLSNVFNSQNNPKPKGEYE